MRKLVTFRRTQQAPDPIVVFGSPRSGTSYLNRLLNEHPDVYLTEEARLFVWMHHSLNLMGDTRFVRKHRERFIEHVRVSYPELIRSFYRELKPSARYWGDKNPHYAAPENQGCLEAIAELFPGTHFIHLIRDGRDVVISLMRKGWTSFDEAHDIWMNHVDIGSRFGAQASARYLEIRYEDVVYDDVAAARRLFGFLGIELHEGVLKFCQRQQLRRTPFKRPTRDLHRGVTTSDWGRLLAPDQRLRSLELIGNHLVQLGYESETSLKDAKEGLYRECASASVHPVRAVVRQVVPASGTVIVVSDRDDELLLAMDGRRAWHFPQREGGHNIAVPLDAVDTEAIAMLEALETRGGDFLLVPKVAFPWLERREDFRRHIGAHHRRIWADDLCLIFELGRSATMRATGPGVAN
jgi:hypothetical protein